MKRLLMISYPFPPNVSAGAVRSERFARYLAEFGWEVFVVTIKARQDLHADEKRIKNMGDHVYVHATFTFDPWLKVKDKRPRNIFSRVIRSILMKLFSWPDHMLFWVPFAVREGLSICKSNRIEAIYTTSPPHSTHLAGLILSKLTKKPLIADFRDPWTLNAYRKVGFWGKMFLQLERIMEKAVLNNAARVLANTKANRKNLLHAFPILSKNKVIHIPNGWEEFPPQFHEVCQSDTLTIVHAGTFYPKFKPYALLYALASWRMGNQPEGIPPLKDIAVILLGARDSSLPKIIDDLGLQDIVKIESWVDGEEARRVMCKADILWASLGTGHQSATFLPSKLFEYIAAKRTIFGFFPEGEASSLIHSTGTGEVFYSDKPEPVIRALHHAHMVKEGQELSEFARNEDIIHAYHVRSITEKLDQALCSVIA